MTQLWVEKYRPKRVAEVVGNQKSVKAFVEWMRSWELGKPKTKAVLLYGPAGVGKTSLVLAYAREHGYDVIEVNASDWRNQERMNAVVGESSQQATLEGTTKKIIMVDEVDGIAGQEDAGGLSALRKIIDITRVPIALIANNPWDPRLASIRNRCLMLEFRRLGKRDVIKRLREICRMEGIEATDEALKALAERSEGDLRSAINDLQAIAVGRKRIDSDAVAVLGERNRVKQIFEALRIIFNAKSLRAARAALEGLEVDLDMVYTWVLDNAPLQIPDPEELAQAYEMLARADIFLTRMKRLQRWRLMRYAIPLMTGGVSLTRKTRPRGFVKFAFPSKIRLMQKSKEERELRQSIASKIAKRLRLSRAKAMKDVLPYLMFMASTNPEYGEKLAEHFNLSPSETKYLTGGKVEAAAMPAAEKKGKPKRRRRSRKSSPSRG